MVNIEREKETVAFQIENGDQNGTYEKKKSDGGNQTVFIGKRSNTKVLMQKKTKKKETEKAIFID